MTILTAFITGDFVRVIKKKKRRKQSRDGGKVALLNQIIMIGIVGFIFLNFSISSDAYGATYYISPSGSDSNPGTTDKPWKTFNYAINKLLAGDTLILKDGTYTETTSGLPYINCAKGAKSGTATKPITIRAENERKAFLQSDGSTRPFRILYCSWWNIEGLRAESSDHKNGVPHIFLVDYSRDIKVRRLLLTKTNRYINGAALLVYESNNILVEESEAYWFHRHGIEAFRSNNVIFRRNYAHSRNYGSVSPPPSSDRNLTAGDEGISFYKTSNSICENSISEASDWGFSMHADGGYGKNNQYLGCIALNNLSHGFVIDSRGNQDSQKAEDTILENVAAISNKSTGIFLRSTVDTECYNCSTLYGKGHGLIADLYAGYQADEASMYCTNCLFVGNSKQGVGVKDHVNWQIYSSNSFANGNNYVPNDKNVVNSTELDPKIGSCKVYVPSGSPLRDKGIGANIIYRYEDGILTSEKLWDQDIGGFPCGATIKGVNDDSTFPTSSCVNVHKRLNVGANGCPIP